MSKSTIIEVRGLTKKFDKFKALDNLNLTVEQGQVHGFLGPNGSGKSTTIRVLLGLLRKTSGTATLFGQDPWDKAVNLHSRLAYVPGDVNLWPNLSGGEAIDLIGALRGGLDKKRRAHLIDVFQLDPKKKFRTYSKGNRQKVALVAGLASDVELYILDEPTSGLDPLMESIFQEEIQSLRRSGKTVLLSSHILAEVEALCDRVTIIREGRTVETGTLDQLRHLHRTTIKAQTEKPVTGLEKIKGVHNLRSKNNHVEFEVEPADLDKALEKLTKLNIRAITSHPPTLEELFLRHYDDEPGVKT
ncbi:MAG: ABC transporter ATP-binding protein [Candidatus Saccharibacteria bacterium]|nr:ABC transporter ATP-binding protein [Candidatus Saccharibacteria bacterium]